MVILPAPKPRAQGLLNLETPQNICNASLELPNQIQQLPYSLE